MFYGSYCESRDCGTSMCSAKGSIMRLKISSDKGHPCWVLLVIWNGLDSISEVYTWAAGFEYNANMVDRMCP